MHELGKKGTSARLNPLLLCICIGYVTHMGGGIKFSTLTVFLLRLWQNPLNGSKAPSVQAHSLGSPGEAPPNNAINQLVRIC